MSVTKRADNPLGPLVDMLAIFLVLIGLVLLSLTIHIRLLQIPGYLLFASTSLVKNLFLPGLSGLAWQAFLVGYLSFFAILLGIGTYRIRTKR